ncbi:YgiW/YdeI family stress tolerance OB fold protein [Morganella morganii]|nr:NirD/YgiW/YdeI family stress tolerance protein [Morganella morganii]
MAKLTLTSSSFYLFSAIALTGLFWLQSAAALPSFSAYEYHQSTVKCETPQRFIIKQLPYLQDNSRVILEGNIQTQVSAEYYLLGDYSGIVEVKIPADLWGKKIITPNDTIRIEGGMEKDRHAIVVTADTLSVVNPGS